MAGSYGYKFIFASAIFYLFLGFMLSIGGSAYLTATISMPPPAIPTISGGGSDILTLMFNLFADFVNAIQTLLVILINPFSGIGFLAWLSIGILITNVYIIITSVIP